MSIQTFYSINIHFSTLTQKSLYIELPIKLGKMKSIQFVREIWKTGSGSYVITIPKAFIESEVLLENKKYEITITEIE